MCIFSNSFMNVIQIYLLFHFLDYLISRLLSFIAFVDRIKLMIYFWQAAKINSCTKDITEHCLYPTASLNLLVISNCLWWNLGFYVCRVISSTKQKCFDFLSSHSMHFISLSSLIAKAQTFSTLQYYELSSKF